MDIIKKRKRILAYIDTQWSIGRVFNDLNVYISKDFDIFLYDWAKYSPDDIILLIDNFDIFITNLFCIKYFIDLPFQMLKKTIFCCHGFPELELVQNISLPEECTYSIVSDSIKCLFPTYIQDKLYHTYNGVLLSNFNYVKHNGILKTIGWCGAEHVESKRSK